VRADADLDKAVDTLMDGAMFNSGQCCCGIERIYVHESLYDAFVDKAVAWVNGNMKLGNPLDKETTIGPMANVRFAQEVRAQIRGAGRWRGGAHRHLTGRRWRGLCHAADPHQRDPRHAKSCAMKVLVRSSASCRQG
jgi:acyl-CoA reductase-like NAD-dependent aldehyde dehydrogenase